MRREPDSELEKVAAAVDQLDRAEHYLLAAIDLELAAPALRQALHRLRSRVLAVRQSLARPRPLRP